MKVTINGVEVPFTLTPQQEIVYSRFGFVRFLQERGLLPVSIIWVDLIQTEQEPPPGAIVRIVLDEENVDGAN